MLQTMGSLLEAAAVFLSPQCGSVELDVLTAARTLVEGTGTVTHLLSLRPLHFHL